MTTKYEFRDILPEELDQVIQIEQICFPPNEACSAKCMRERVANAPETFMVAVDKETGKTVETWKSTKEPHEIKGLEVGKSYILKEISAPSHYEKAGDIEFKVEEDMQVQHLVMKDKRTPITVVQTGDETKVMPLLAIVLGAGIAVLVLYRKSKKQ